MRNFSMNLTDVRRTMAMSHVASPRNERCQRKSHAEARQYETKRNEAFSWKREAKSEKRTQPSRRLAMFPDIPGSGLDRNAAP
jgi:hypothetical protein